MAGPSRAPARSPEFINCLRYRIRIQEQAACFNGSEYRQEARAGRDTGTQTPAQEGC